MMKRKSTNRNFVVNHSINKSGAGAHVPKKGDKAPRCCQKRNWKKEILNSY
jgi:hypothetical protein